MISPTVKDKEMAKNFDMSIDEKDKYGLFYDEYKRFGIQDRAGTGKFLIIETNWNKAVEKNEILKLKIGDQIVYLSNKELREVIKLLAPLVEVEQMLEHSKRFYLKRKCTIKFIASQRYDRGDEIYLSVDLPMAYS